MSGRVAIQKATKAHTRPRIKLTLNTTDEDTTHALRCVLEDITGRDIPHYRNDKHSLSQIVLYGNEVRTNSSLFKVLSAIQPHTELRSVYIYQVLLWMAENTQGIEGRYDFLQLNTRLSNHSTRSSNTYYPAPAYLGGVLSKIGSWCIRRQIKEGSVSPQYLLHFELSTLDFQLCNILSPWLTKIRVGNFHTISRSSGCYSLLCTGIAAQKLFNYVSPYLHREESKVQSLIQWLTICKQRGERRTGTHTPVSLEDLQIDQYYKELTSMQKGKFKTRLADKLIHTAYQDVNTEEDDEIVLDKEESAVV
jgi:hypothetical protein